MAHFCSTLGKLCVALRPVQREGNRCHWGAVTTSQPTIGSPYIRSQENVPSFSNRRGIRPLAPVYTIPHPGLCLVDLSQSLLPHTSRKQISLFVLVRIVNAEQFHTALGATNELPKRPPPSRVGIENGP